MRTKIMIGIAICTAVFGLNACGKSFPEGSGEIMTKLVGHELSTKRSFYSIYVREFDKDEDGEEKVKCYEVSQDEYEKLSVGDVYIPEGSR